MSSDPKPFPINYPEIKPDDTDQMIRERCLLYVLGNDSKPSFFCLRSGIEIHSGIEACASEAQRLFEYIKTGIITTPFSCPGKDKS